MPDPDAAAAPECQLCPLCQAMAALRSARPEAVDHLLKAGAELLLAARALLETPAEAGADGGPAPRRRRARPARPGPAAGNGLQHIDIG
jgi:adenine-specific DNA glycosylase